MKLYIVLLLEGQFPSSFWATCSDLNNTEKSFLQKILDLNLLTSICLSTSARQVWLELSVMSAELNL